MSVAPPTGREESGRAADEGGAFRPPGGPRGHVGLYAGPLLFLALLWIPAPEGLALPAWRTAAVGALMAVWWLTEAIPIPATALVPLVALPLLGAGAVGEVAAPYANPIIFLFLGGFLLALAMERWELHRRIALRILARVGTRPAALVGGFMAATAFLSMWVSNTATAMMMLPIGVSVLAMAGEEDRLPAALMLGIAYAASLGGLATLVGTPPNALLAGFMLETYGREIGFAEWLLVGVPLAAVALPLAYLVLTRLAFRLGREPVPGAREAIAEALARLGGISRPERRVAGVFVATALLWILRPLLERALPGLSDAGVAVAAGLALFVLPAGAGRGGALLSWGDTRRLPWGVLVLFGGGLSLADAVDRTGLNVWIGRATAGLGDGSPLFLVLGVTACVVLLTELTSNTATAAAFLPVLGAVAAELGWDPLLLAAPAALAASCAFMLPVATPPNAIVYGSGRVSAGDMARAGVWLNAALVLVVTAAALVLVPAVLGG